MGGDELALIGTIAAAIISGTALVVVAKINRDNKPIREVMKQTKLQGDGSLVEALSILQQQYKDSQQRAREEIDYYFKQAIACRRAAEKVQQEFDEYREKSEKEIADLKARLSEHERRLNQSHVGKGQ